MLSAKSFSKPWIDSQAKNLGAQAIILEKCIHALELVGRLAEAELDFVFKGGTSLILQLQPVRRLSIDVDIACLESLASFRTALDTVAKSPPFTHWEHQEWRDAENPPAKYFRVFYPSPTLAGQESSIQLDILLARSPYAVLESRAVRTAFVEVEKPVTVRVPSVDCLLGDKLSAFAPTTIGVLYQPFSKKTGELNRSLAELRSLPPDAKILQSLRIVGPWAKLQKLRNTNTEAFYHWHQASLLNP